MRKYKVFTEDRHRLNLNIGLNLQKKLLIPEKTYVVKSSQLLRNYITNNSLEEIYFIVRNENISFISNNQVINV